MRGVDVALKREARLIGGGAISRTIHEAESESGRDAALNGIRRAHARYPDAGSGVPSGMSPKPMRRSSHTSLTR